MKKTKDQHDADEDRVCVSGAEAYAGTCPGITLCRLGTPPQQAARRVMGTHGDHNTSSFFTVRLLGHYKLVHVPHGHAVEGGGVNELINGFLLE